MNQENILPSFYFSIKEYLHIFDINSLLTLNNFINTRLNSDIAKITVYRIFIYGVYEFQKSIINSPELTINIIQKILIFLKQTHTDDKVNKIYKMILNAKNLNDFEKIQVFIEK
jgi:hypothetical protein